MVRGAERRNSGFDEIAAVWLLLLLMAVALVVTYARLPPEELYNVSDAGVWARSVGCSST